MRAPPAPDVKKLLAPEPGQTTTLPTTDVTPAAPQSMAPTLPWLRRVNKLFLGAVVVPTLLASLYFGLFASDIYISESQYVVRSPQRQAPTGLGAFLQSAGFTRAQDDTYTVQEYIASRDALQLLEQSLGIKARYASPSIDRLRRFGGLDGDTSFEALHRYFAQRVELTTDPMSSVSTLKVRAFTAEDAQSINERLLLESEALINQLNERGRQDLIRFAEREVHRAEARATSATLELSAFRHKQGVFDPTNQSALQLQLVSKLQDELITTRTQLAQVRSLSAQNPQIPSLELRLKTLQSAIDAENNKVTGGDRSLSGKAAVFERLALEREFAERQLAAAMSSLEQARNDAMRKQLYLERISQPGLADIAVEPRRVRSIFSVLLLGLVAWGILAMLVAGVREHQD